MLRSNSNSSPSGALKHYVLRRPGTQNYQLRVMVPAHLRPILLRREFTRSLRTADKLQAVKLAWPILAEWQAHIDEAEARIVKPPQEARVTEPTAYEIDEAALLIAYEEATTRAQALIRLKARSGPDAFSALQDVFARRHRDALRKLHAGDHAFWQERARRHVAQCDWHLPESSDGFTQFVESLARCGADFFARANAIMDGRGDTFIPSGFVSEVADRRRERAADGEDIMSLYDRYAAERLATGRKRQDTLDQDRKVVEGFARFVGERRKLASILPDQIRDWRNLVASLPTGINMNHVYSGLTLKEAAEKAKEIGGKTISLTTTNRYLSAVSALFKWAKREGIVATNVCDGLFYEIDKQANPRPPFDVSQINTILHSPLFVGYLDDGREHSVGSVTERDWRFWIPLICLFTGARIGEVAQLRAIDIQEIDGHWIIRISNEPKAGVITKTGKSRIVPVHSILRKIGCATSIFASGRRQL